MANKGGHDLSQQFHRMALFDVHLATMGVTRALILATVTGTVAACAPTVKFEAPDEPIRLEINITIEQEVLIKVDRALDDVFEEQGDIFGLSGES